jgi:hypothetical protein
MQRENMASERNPEYEIIRILEKKCFDRPFHKKVDMEVSL